MDGSGGLGLSVIGGCMDESWRVDGSGWSGFKWVDGWTGLSVVGQSATGGCMDESWMLGGSAWSGFKWVDGWLDGFGCGGSKWVVHG